MNAVFGIGLGTAVTVLLAVGIIVYIALNRYSKEQWRRRIRSASQEVWNGSGQSSPAAPQPRNTSFGEIWEDKSRTGSAYFSVQPTMAGHLGSDRPSKLPAPQGRGDQIESAPALQHHPFVEPGTSNVSQRRAAESRLPALTPVEGSLATVSSEDAERFSFPQDGRSIA